MQLAQSNFLRQIEEAKELTALYVYLKGQFGDVIKSEEILRYQVVYAVSAFDKLIHDIIRSGMLQSFAGLRPQTEKFKAESITLEVHHQLANASIPPMEYIFEQEILRKLSKNSYQDPDKVAEGLALIWTEKHKWNAIASHLHQPAEQLRTKLRLIATRRNSIVHEADMNPMTHLRNHIDDAESLDVVLFLESLGTAICDLVR